VWISEQTAIISLYSINWLVSITETECVYCAVLTESLLHLGLNLIFKTLELVVFPKVLWCTDELYKLKDILGAPDARGLPSII
jgi:hypothetical protein